MDNKEFEVFRGGYFEGYKKGLEDMDSYYCEGCIALEEELEVCEFDDEEKKTLCKIKKHKEANHGKQ